MCGDGKKFLNRLCDFETEVGVGFMRAVLPNI
jgi:hypothetical protein